MLLSLRHGPRQIATPDRKLNEYLQVKQEAMASQCSLTYTELDEAEMAVVLREPSSEEGGAAPAGSLPDSEGEASSVPDALRGEDIPKDVVSSQLLQSTTFVSCESLQQGPIIAASFRPLQLLTIRRWISHHCAMLSLTVLRLERAVADPL